MDQCDRYISSGKHVYMYPGNYTLPNKIKRKNFSVVLSSKSLKQFFKGTKSSGISSIGIWKVKVEKRHISGKIQIETIVYGLDAQNLDTSKHKLVQRIRLEPENLLIVKAISFLSTKYHSLRLKSYLSHEYQFPFPCLVKRQM